jgi:hypothetical protein
MAGGAGATNIPLSGANCPDQYAQFHYEAGKYGCSFSGVISVVIENKPWANIYWSNGDSVTEYSAEAKASGATSSRFDADLAKYQQQVKEEEERKAYLRSLGL